jgi:superfamily II DNA/RNA helicase
MEQERIISSALSGLGIEAPNEMQEKALQTILNEPNTVLLAPTGSGKTLAFLLPVLQLLDPDRAGVQCLVISPTRELAIQIERVWQKMSTGFKVNTCYGGHPMTTEVQNLSQPPALLIGTPGRLTEHVARQTFDPSTVRILVLDEFDKSLSMGFQEQMAEIIQALPNLEKRVLASATEKLNIPAFTGISNPKVLNYNKAAEKSTDGLVLRTVVSPTQDKIDTLSKLLRFIGPESTLIFCNQREATERVKAGLDEEGILSAFFHGGMEQQDRENTLVQFRNGTIVYLVASDLAARGLDIPEVRNVVHFELPLKNNDFIHRNGRTARMFAEGTAYLIRHSNESLPAYFSQAPEEFRIPENLPLPEPSPWTTLYISGGKKDKISRTDIVGFLSKKGELKKDDLGKIEVLDLMSFVAVKKEVVKRLLESVKDERMKGKKYRIMVAK